MAVGDILLEPETGWNRYDDRNKLFTYSGNWELLNLSQYYNGTLNYTNELQANVVFKFNGTKLRIIGRSGANGGDLGLTIDGVTYSISNRATSEKFQSVIFEKTNLPLGNHTVVLSKTTTANIWFDAIDIVGNLINNEFLIIKGQQSNQYYSLEQKTLILLPNVSGKTFIDHGIEVGDNIRIDELFDKVRTVIDNEDGTQTITEESVDPFYIYDVLGDELEVLFYTEDESAIGADITLEANWSPIDELVGDFELVTWTDEENANRQLELTAIPTPKLTYSLDIKNITGTLNSILSNDTSTYYNKSNVRYLLSPNNSDWYVFNNGNFIKLNDVDNNTIETLGMTYTDISALSSVEFANWNFDKLNIGVYLSDNARDTVISKVSTIGFKENSTTDTSTVSDASFYILNTTAAIDLQFNGLTLTGELSDADSTRVQYRVKLNGNSYFPMDGNFTQLEPSPKNIDITLRSSEIKIGDWNDLEVEFQDYFGTVDTWSINFMGEYAGLMFSDANGDYYSTDVGDVLKYLDFGQILTGQTTPSYQINLKNQHGYDVNSVALSADTSNFPNGLEVQFSLTDDFTNAKNSVEVGNLAVNEQVTFYIRMFSPIYTMPNGNNTFDIYVTAKREV